MLCVQVLRQTLYSYVPVYFCIKRYTICCNVKLTHIVARPLVKLWIILGGDSVKVCGVGLIIIQIFYIVCGLAVQESTGNDSRIQRVED